MDKRALVLSALLRFRRRWGKKYCFPSQETLLKFMAGKYKTAMCRRTLCRALKSLEGSGLLHRIRRHYNDSVKGYTFRSTVYYLKEKTWQFKDYFNRYAEIARVAVRVTFKSHNRGQIPSVSSSPSLSLASSCPSQEGRASWLLLKEALTPSK